jgi:single-strand DNA-binding protein
MRSKGNVNKIILVGNLGKSPELRHTPKGHTVTTLSVATNHQFKNASGETKKETSWHKATVWGKTAEACVKYLAKGDRVCVEGELHMKDWKDKEGKARRTPEIAVDTVTFLGGTKPSGSKEGDMIHMH